MERDREYRDYGGHQEVRYDGGGHKRIPGRSMSSSGDFVSKQTSPSLHADETQGPSPTMGPRWYNGCGIEADPSLEAPSWKWSGLVRAI